MPIVTSAAGQTRLKERGSYEQGSRYEHSGDDRSCGLCCVRVGRDSGGARGTQPRMGRGTRMADDAAAL